MNNNVQITELNFVDRFADKLKITGTVNERQAGEAAEEWTEKHNCLYKGISLDGDGSYYLATVFTDDYK